MLQHYKKLKLYTQNWVKKRCISLHIRNYLWSFVDYEHLKMYFYNSTSHWTTASSVKSVSGVILSGYTPGSIKYSHFDTIISPTLKKVKRIQTRKIDGFSSSSYSEEENLVSGWKLPYFEVNGIYKWSKSWYTYNSHVLV